MSKILDVINIILWVAFLLVFFWLLVFSFLHEGSPRVIQRNYEIYLKVKNVDNESLTLDEFKHLGLSTKDIRKMLIYNGEVISK